MLNIYLLLLLLGGDREVRESLRPSFGRQQKAVSCQIFFSHESETESCIIHRVSAVSVKRNV